MKRIFILTAIAFLAACSNTPSVTDSNNIRDIPKGYEAVSICHSGDASEKQEIEDLAIGVCPAGTGNLQPWDFDWFMNSCPVMKRKRITFLCTQ